MSQVGGGQLEVGDAPVGDRRAPWRRALSVQTFIVVLASWTIGYWVAAAVGIGWALAVPVAVITMGGMTVGLRPWRDVAAYLPAPGENLQLTAALVLVVLWPLLYELGSWVLAILAALALTVRLVLSRRGGASLIDDARLVALLAVFAGTAIAVAVSVRLGLALVVAASLVAVLRPTWFEELFSLAHRRSGRGDPGDAPEDDELEADRPWDRPWMTTALLLCFGVIIAIWVAGYGPFWNGDNAYHLNKAAHYAASPGRWAPQDYMYGVEGLDHFPYVNFLNSYEALIGVLSRLTGLSPWDLVYRGVVPLVSVLAPFAARFAARGLGIRRAGLAGGLCGVALIISPSIGATTFASLSIGKMIGPLVLAPILIGTAALVVSRPSARHAALAVVATIALLATSPSHIMSAGILLAAFSGTAAWNAWRERRDASTAWWRTAAIALAPLAFAGAFALFARAWQSQADPIQERLAAVFTIPDGTTAWEIGGLLAGPPISWMTAALLLGSTIALVWFASHQVAQRRALGAAFAVAYGLMLPIIFRVVVDDLLDLRLYSYRLFVVFFAPVVIGLGLAAVDRSRLGVLTACAIVIAIGLAGPSIEGSSLVYFRPQSPKIWEAPLNWPAGNDASTGDKASANRLLAATPLGGRFLGFGAVEEIATARSTNRFPTYVRGQFVRSFTLDAGTPDAFRGEERLMLENAANASPGPPLDVEELVLALDAVRVDAACVAPDSDPLLSEALGRDFERVEVTPSCDLWVRKAR